MAAWQPPRYDVGSGRHLPDPADATACLCGHTWDHLPTEEEWAEHKYGPPQQGPVALHPWWSSGSGRA